DLTDGVSQRHRIAHGAQLEEHLLKPEALRCLQPGRVRNRRNLAFEGVVARRLRHAHDFNIGHVCFPAEREMASQWILTTEIFLREDLVDYAHSWTAFDVAFVKGPPSQDGDLHRFKKSRPHLRDRSIRPSLALGRRRYTGNRYAGSAAPASNQWEVA